MNDIPLVFVNVAYAVRDYLWYPRPIPFEFKKRFQKIPLRHVGKKLLPSPDEPSGARSSLYRWLTTGSERVKRIDQGSAPSIERVLVRSRNWHNLIMSPCLLSVPVPGMCSSHLDHRQPIIIRALALRGLELVLHFRDRACFIRRELDGRCHGEVLGQEWSAAGHDDGTHMPH